MCSAALNDPLASPLTCLSLCLLFSFFLFLPGGDFCARSPPETKTDSAIDSPDAQRQEWFAQYFSFWLTTKPAKHKDSACQQNLRRKKKKKTEIRKNNNNKKKTLKKMRKNVQTICYLLSLIGVGIGSLQTQSAGSLIRGLRIKFVIGQFDGARCPSSSLRWMMWRWAASCRWLRGKWTDPDRQTSSLWSDLIVWFSLIVSLWMSFSLSTVTMIISLFRCLFDFFTSWLIFNFFFFLQFHGTRKKNWVVHYHAANCHCWTPVRNIYIKKYTVGYCALSVRGPTAYSILD